MNINFEKVAEEIGLNHPEYKKELNLVIDILKSTSKIAVNNNISDIISNMEMIGIIKRKEVNKLGEYIIAELDVALNKSENKIKYTNKKVNDIIRIKYLSRKLRILPIEEIAKTLSYILDNNKVSKILVNALIEDLDNLKEFNELLQLDERFEY